MNSNSWICRSRICGCLEPYIIFKSSIHFGFSRWWKWELSCEPPRFSAYSPKQFSIIRKNKVLSCQPFRTNIFQDSPKFSRQNQFSYLLLRSWAFCIKIYMTIWFEWNVLTLNDFQFLENHASCSKTTEIRGMIRVLIENLFFRSIGHIVVLSLYHFDSYKNVNQHF